MMCTKSQPRIIGVIPAGGKARRVHGFFKEMMPIGVNEKDKSQFVVSSERIAEIMLDGGATAVHMILSSHKSFIQEYYGKQRLFPGKINFNTLDPAVEELGMPYTIDTLFPQTQHFDYVLMGMPDTVIEPSESFANVLALIMQCEADLALGLYHTDDQNPGGFIQFNKDSKKVLSHFDKKSEDTFPDSADNSWAIACWNKNFTHYMHDLLTRRAKDRLQSPDSDLIFGHVIDSAIANHSPVKVVADFVDEENGFYWDITDPIKYFNLLHRHSPVDTSSIESLRTDLHPEVYRKCRSLYESRAYAEAVEKGFKVVRDRLRSLTGHETGSEAFGKGKLHIRGAAAENVDDDFNNGVKFLTMAIDRFRNEKSHTSDAKIAEPIRAYEYLRLSSLAMQLLDSAEILS